MSESSPNASGLVVGLIIGTGGGLLALGVFPVMLGKEYGVALPGLWAVLLGTLGAGCGGVMGSINGASFGRRLSPRLGSRLAGPAAGIVGGLIATIVLAFFSWMMVIAIYRGGQ